jgi:hypothetical protein
MMQKFLTAVGAFTVGILFVIGIATLGAYPTKWVVNYLFTPGVLIALFGISQLTFWKALALNFIAASLFKGANGRSTK